MPSLTSALHHRTPHITVFNNRGQSVRALRYQRHPDTPGMTDERITRHQYDISGHLVKSNDPRLYEAMQQAGSKVKPNFRYQNALSGDVLRTESVDAGSTCLLKDAFGRPAISRNAEGGITCWHYEPEGAGRLLSIIEKATSVEEKVRERFSYADNTPENRAHNLAGSLIAHYDTAGVNRTEDISLTGVPLSVTQQLLKDEEEANWQGEEIDWTSVLAETVYQTHATADSAGAVLTQTDAKGNVQRHTYDIDGMLKKSTLTLKGESTATDLFKKVTYSASGQKQQEVHGNGIISTYTYEPETQRLTGIKVERPASHPKGAKVFQDLHYTYDPVGNVLSVENSAEEIRFFRNKKIAPKNTYRYDTLYQLVTATGREMVSNSGPQITLPESISPLSDNTQYSSYTRDYAYDQGGNLTQIRHHAPESQKRQTTDILISNKSNRGILKTAGLLAENIDTLFHPGGHQKALLKGQALNWTQRGELASVKMTGSDTEIFRYDAKSQRATKITTRQHSGSVHTEKVIYLGNLEIRTRHQDGKLKEALHRISAGNIQFLHWETGKPDGMDNNHQRHSHGDIIDSRGLELDHNGELISQEEYYPYGGTSIWTAKNKTEADYKTIRYSGKESDATGLYYYGYRYYQSWLGRWLSADPAGTIDGLNLYRMVRNNPVRLKDETGLKPGWHRSFSLAPLSVALNDNTEAPLRSWMSFLSDDVKINHISIPGTHESGARKGINFVKCQKGTISDQLDAGIRFLDIRVAVIAKEMRIYHGPVSQGLSLQDVFDDVQDFLSENSSEFIFIKIKQEHSKVKNEKFGKMFSSTARNYPTLFAENPSVQDTVKDVRGKIILIADNAGLKNGLDWKNKEIFDKQGDWSYPVAPTKEKIKKVKRQLEKTNSLLSTSSDDSEKIYVNQLNASGHYNLTRTPSNFSDEINIAINDHIDEMRDQFSNLKLGWMSMDYATKTDGRLLTAKIIRENFSPSNITGYTHL